MVPSLYNNGRFAWKWMLDSAVCHSGVPAAGGWAGRGVSLNIPSRIPERRLWELRMPNCLVLPVERVRLYVEVNGFGVFKCVFNSQVSNEAEP